MRAARLLRVPLAPARRLGLFRPLLCSRMLRPARLLHSSRFLLHQAPRIPNENDNLASPETAKRLKGHLIAKDVGEFYLVTENGQDLQSAQRYHTIFNDLSDSFLHYCDVYRRTQDFSSFSAEDTAKKFADSHPGLEPITASHVKEVFEYLYKLAKEEAYTEDLKFTDPVVSEIHKKTFTYFENGNAICVDKYGFEVVRVWKKTFDTLAAMMNEDHIIINPADPDALLELEPLEKSSNVNFEEKKNVSEEEIKPEERFFKESKEEHKHEETGPKKSSPKKSQGQKVFEVEFTSQQARLFFMGAVGGLLLFFVWSKQEDKNEITFQEFTADFLRKNLVSRIRVVNNKVAILELNEMGNASHANSKDFYFNIGNVESFERNLKAVQDQYKFPDQLRIPVVYVSEGSTAKVLVNFVPTLLFLGAIYYMTKKAGMGGMGGPLGFGKSTAKKFNQEKDIKVKFKDVAGMNEAKDEVMEFVKFLQNPAKYEKLGAKIPRGAILSGPPGTGKTLIAKATAGEAGVPFYSVSGSEFVEMFVGVGASRVRDLFKTARENAPSIVFVDEIDAIGKQRSKGNASGANDERETTLNQLLVEMDGFDTSDHVVVLAGTNRADILDKALMRPGRFDRHIAIDNPELQGRKEIFDVHLKKIKLVSDIDKDLSGRLAALTPGFSGADIANVCNEAALIAARFNAKSVSLRHFELAIERVIGGIEKKSKLLSPEEKKIVAYHEAGHAVCGWYLKHAHPLLKVSIIPRGQGALGYAQYLPPDQYLMSAAQLYDRMIMTLGGRVSEEINFASVTSGAYDDFKKVTNIAQSMVMRFGMSPKVGMVNYADTQGQDTLTKPFSDETNNIIDEEIKRIVTDCHDKCKDLLTEKSEAVELVAQELLKKEFITREDMIRLLGKRPFPETNDAFDKYLDGKDAFKNEDAGQEKKATE
ncbi:hypothetical protein JCM33374_g1215 [Metschnikowia sp. JCM 33374]|nr:hypothetical protein JCM33374_g1215 [Metschnikowia sp. JCM 33374]